MSFCVSHRSALDKNIRHLYSGRPSSIALRGGSKATLDGAIDIMDRVRERHKRPPERFETKFQEYLPQYSARLPRAPAFRNVSPEEARQISHRLSRPTFMSAIRRQSAVKRGATARSEARRSRTTSGKTESDRDAQDGDRNNAIRKVSYQDWSDEEGGVYYYEDDESSLMDTSGREDEKWKNEKNRDSTTPNKEVGNHVIDFNTTPSTKVINASERRYQPSHSIQKSLHQTSSSHASGDPYQNHRSVTTGSRSSSRSRSRSRSRSVSSNSESDSGSHNRDHQRRPAHNARHEITDDEEPNIQDISRISSNPTTALSSSVQSVVTDGTSTKEDHSFQAPQGKANTSKKKISILEQIMQARAPHNTTRPPQRTKSSHAPNGSASNKANNSYSSGGEYSRRLPKRKPLDIRLKRSPYCEPTPQLYIVYTPVSNRHDLVYCRDQGQKSRRSHPGAWSLPNSQSQTMRARARTAPSGGRGGMAKTPGGQHRRLSPRPQTQQGQKSGTVVQTIGQRSAPRAIATSEAVPRQQNSREPARSKSVPPPPPTNGATTASSRAPNPAEGKQSSNPQQTKPSNELDDRDSSKNRQSTTSHSKPRFPRGASSKKVQRHPDDNSEESVTKCTTAKRDDTTLRSDSSDSEGQTKHGAKENQERHKGSERDIVSDRTTKVETYNSQWQRERSSSEKSKDNPQSATVLRDDVDDDDDDDECVKRYHVYAGDEVYGEAVLYYANAGPEERSRRFASPEEMWRANTRLQKPTKVKTIRDRMRWAPNNNEDLADPVKVIREVTGGHEDGRWRRRKGDDARGEADGKHGESMDRNDDSSSSGEDEKDRTAETERQETLAGKRNARQRAQRNKKEEWVKKGVIQPKKNLFVAKPTKPAKRGTVARQPVTQKSVKAVDRTRPEPMTGKEPKKSSGSGHSEKKCSFPRPHAASRARSPSPKARASSSSSSRSSRSKSTIRSRSRSRSSEKPRSRSNSRSRSLSSRSVSRSTSASTVEGERRSLKKDKVSRQEIAHKDSSLTMEKATSETEPSRDQNRKEEPDISDVEQDRKEYKRRGRDEDIQEDSNTTNREKLDAPMMAITNEVPSTTEQPNSELANSVSQSEENQIDETKIQGIVKQFEMEEADRKTTESPEAGRNSGLDYATGSGSRGGRGDEYSDRGGRGDENNRMNSTPSQAIETKAVSNGYTQNRQTRGGGEESSRSDDAITDDDESESKENTQQAMTYSVKENITAETNDLKERRSVENDPTQNESSYLQEEESFNEHDSAVTDNNSREYVKEDSGITNTSHEHPGSRERTIRNDVHTSETGNKDYAEENTHLHPGALTNKVHDQPKPFVDIANSLHSPPVTTTTDKDSTTTHSEPLKSTINDNGSNPNSSQANDNADVFTNEGSQHYNRRASQERQGFEAVDLDASWRGQD